MKIDLHTHSTYSDGTLEPQELIKFAAQLGITHIALCDHDSTEGLNEAFRQAKDCNISLVPAVEINTKETELIDHSIHILGYYIDEKSEKLQEMLKHYREVRIKRAESIVERLRRMGFKISMSDFNGRKEKAAIGRPHIADKLKEIGIVFSRQEAFDKFLARGKSAYVFYEGPSPKEAIEMILECKGIPVLAHPGFLIQTDTIDSLIKIGLQGIEIYYPSHSSEQIRNFLEFANRNNLIVTGGSDYHGPGSGHESIGEIEVPSQIIDKLLERKQKPFG